jgi:hypothetical protein
MALISNIGFQAGPDMTKEEQLSAREKVNAWPRARKLAVFAQGSHRVEIALKKFPREMWNFKPVKNKWCIGEVLWHLADLEANFYVRLRRAIAEPGKIIISFDQDKWSSRLFYVNADFGQALAIFRLLRRANADLLRRVPASAWKAKVRHPERGLISADWMVGLNIWHLEHHIGQMAKRFREWKSRKSR